MPPKVNRLVSCIRYMSIMLCFFMAILFIVSCTEMFIYSTTEGIAYMFPGIDDLVFIRFIWKDPCGIYREFVGVQSIDVFESLPLVEISSVRISVSYLYLGNGDLRYFLNDYRTGVFCGNVMTVSASAFLFLFFYMTYRFMSRSYGIQ